MEDNSVLLIVVCEGFYVNLFVVTGASLLLIGLHAVFYRRLDENGFELEMEEVTVG